jgi:hypothetical protein
VPLFDRKIKSHLEKTKAETIAFSGSFGFQITISGLNEGLTVKF